MSVRHRQDTKNSKRVTCAGPTCAARRVHHEMPDTPRGTQYLWISEDQPEPVFCSIECMMYHRGVAAEKRAETLARSILKYLGLTETEIEAQLRGIVNLIREHEIRHKRRKS